MTRPTPPADHAPDAERRALELADAYLARLQAGETPDRNELLAAHPDIADLLDEHLRVVELMYDAARGARPPLTPDPSPPEAGREGRMNAPIANGNDIAATLPPLCPGAKGAGGEGGPPSPLTRLGRYFLYEELGKGASATVYRAYDPRFDREVALKVLRQDRLVTADAADRFERDARIAAQLRHPNIVPLHETGEHAGVRYIDMELVRGETLDAHLRRGRVGFRDAAELVRQVALALDYAHGRGIVHRDVKPSNILLEAGVRGQESGVREARGGGVQRSELGTQYSVLRRPCLLAPVPCRPCLRTSAWPGATAGR